MGKLMLLWCALSCLSAILWYNHRKEEVVTVTTGEIITVPYSLLDKESLSELDKLHADYDPRRPSISILNYISENENKNVPISWDDLIQIDNKTDLGLYWLYQFPIEQIILMKNQLYPFAVDFNTSLPLVDQADSLNKSVQSFFKDEASDDSTTYKSIPLTKDDFNLDFKNNVKGLSPKQQENFDPEIEEYRYFKEGSRLNVTGLAHYDLRFFYSKMLPVDRIAILHRIVRAWARFTNKSKIDTWLAHGSLLGYYFNGLIMPWDDDLDVQVSSKSFWDLVKLNGTLVIDYQDDINLGKYLIDVNPWFPKRERNPENKIDARFIDVESGLYIDITVLTSELSPNDLIDSFDEEERLEFYKVFNPYYDLVLTELEQLSSDLDHSVQKSVEVKELLSCKDYHFYTVEELTPLIPTMFEGEILYVPNNIPNMLLREYGRRSLFLDEFKTFKFDKFGNLWKNDKKKYETNSLMSQFLEDHRTIKQTTFKRHIFYKENLIKYPNFRVEPWIREGNDTDANNSN